MPGVATGRAGPGAGTPLLWRPRAFSPGLALGLASGLVSVFEPNDSRKRRATGGSTVEDADLTNSPCSLSLAKSSLLVTPSSFANSCTRALPATTSPHLEATAVVGAVPRVSYDAWSSRLHGVLMFFATCSSDRVDELTTVRRTRPPLRCPVNRRCATLVRMLAAGLPSVRTAGRDATTHLARAGLPLCQRSRHTGHSRRSPRLHETIRRPTLASDTRRMSAPVRQDCRGCVDA